MGLLILLKRQMNELESHLEYELGVDRLRTLCNKELMFSKNQIGIIIIKKILCRIILCEFIKGL